jgi:c-di-GMP-binding flagellar brake protein YcgR
MNLSLADGEIEDRYFLTGQMEILSVLNDLIHLRENISIFFNEGQDFFLTTLLEARPDCLIFDLSGDDRSNRRLENSRTCVFVGQLNGIRVQFSAVEPARFTWGETDAFWVPLPTRVSRLQRRESYRVLMPVSKPVMVRMTGLENAALGDWPMHDLSVGGMAVTLSGAEPKFRAGDQIARVSFTIAKNRIIQSAAVIRHVSRIGNPRDSTTYRVGMSFQNLPATQGILIQRHILEIEHQRRALLKK